MSPELRLFVQYGTAAPELPRWRLRRWVVHALRAAANDSDGPAAGIRGAELTLRLVDTPEARTLNKDYRERDYATNVLTFEYGAGPDGIMRGDVVICMPVLRLEAAEQGKSIKQHGAHLAIHGVLHALGYDHVEPVEAEHMEALETQLLGTLGLGNPYEPARAPD